MENRLISMFGFELKKEYVLDKIKEYLNINEEIDYENVPEVFKETLHEYFNIKYLNELNANKILRDLKLKVLMINDDFSCKKTINMICKPTGELLVGFSKKDKIQLSNSSFITYDHTEHFDENLITTYLQEMKELVPSEYLLEDIKHFEYSFYHNTELYGTSSLSDIYMGIDPGQLVDFEYVETIIHQNNM
jgi:hypothetical protein